MDSLNRELTDMIFSVCDIKAHTPDELRPGDPLIGPESPLGLDSLDSLEIVVAVERRYGVRIGNENTARRVLSSLDTLAEFVRKNRIRE